MKPLPTLAPLPFPLLSLAICLAMWEVGGGAPPQPSAPSPTAAVAESPTKTNRPAPRPARNEAERKRWIAQLRRLYARPAAEWPAPHVDEGVSWKELGLLPEVAHPPDNPFSPEKAALGKMLFFDPRLSGSGQIACASCHDPDLGWADGRAHSFGHGRFPLSRNAPGVMNTAFYDVLFWDGRAGSLEEQARAVILNPREMHSTEAQVVARLKEVPEYREAFDAAFEAPISLDRICGALAAFERTIVGGRSPFDKFLQGESDALSDAALIGLDLFRREARCMNCHYGPHFSDGKLHDLGLSYYGRKYEDLGRYAVTHRPEHVGRFRTPSLRNVTATAPYMHNGFFALEGVLNMYNAGMATLRRKPRQINDPLFPTKSPLLKPLGLNRQDLGDLRAFLESLAEPRRRVRPPELPGLFSSESERPPKDRAASQRDAT